jgi:hypothetical protein
MYQVRMRAAPGTRFGRPFFASLLLLFHGIALSQTEDPVHRMLAAVERGAIDSVRALLPELCQAYPKEAGYLYLTAITESDADQALRQYQTIVHSYPSSEWADDALLRLYQYHYAIGAYNTADQYLSRLETDYPTSPLLSETQARPTGQAAAPTGSDPALYSVQVALLADRDQAEELLEKMRKLGYTGELRTKRVGEKAMTALWLGSFPSADAAKEFLKKLKNRHRLDGLVVKR